nr:protein TRACHEARY ELEMENT DIFFERENTIATION-RELATED 7A-like [Lolium perenne]
MPEFAAAETSSSGEACRRRCARRRPRAPAAPPAQLQLSPRRPPLLQLAFRHAQQHAPPVRPLAWYCSARAPRRMLTAPPEPHRRECRPPLFTCPVPSPSPAEPTHHPTPLRSLPGHSPPQPPAEPTHRCSSRTKPGRSAARSKPARAAPTSSRLLLLHAHTQAKPGQDTNHRPGQTRLPFNPPPPSSRPAPARSCSPPHAAPNSPGYARLWGGSAAREFGSYSWEFIHDSHGYAVVAYG